VGVEVDLVRGRRLLEMERSWEVTAGSAEDILEENNRNLSESLRQKFVGALASGDKETGKELASRVAVEKSLVSKSSASSPNLASFSFTSSLSHHQSIAP
jgi:hypothetical protein